MLEQNDIIREIPMTWMFPGDYQGTELGTAYLTRELNLIIPPFVLPEAANSSTVFYPILTLKTKPVPKSGGSDVYLGYAYKVGAVSSMPVKINTANGEFSFRGNSACTAGATMTISGINVAATFLGD